VREEEGEEEKEEEEEEEVKKTRKKKSGTWYTQVQIKSFQLFSFSFSGPIGHGC
jgi:hypothetical protein